MLFICILIFRYKMFYRINQERMLKEILKYFVKNKLNVENCVFERVNSLIYMY